jgi:hypothetical protein
MKPIGIATNGMAVQIVPNSQDCLEHGFEAVAMPEFVNGVLQCIEFLFKKRTLSVKTMCPYPPVVLTGNSS